MQDKFAGCFLGLAFGDAICAPYEGGIMERLLWRIIGKNRISELRFTDDTQMSLDIANSFTNEGKLDQDKLALAFSKSYAWSRGYGPSAGKILKKIRRDIPWKKANVSVYKNGSFGNGAAMRAPILAMCFTSSEPAFELSVTQSAEITHSHPLAIEGAILIAYSTAYAFLDMSNDEICNRLIEIAKINTFKVKLQSCKQQLQQSTDLSSREIKRIFGNGITAEQSCITAIYFALCFREMSFLDLLNPIKKLGGDTDTIAAMSGAIWGAFNGEKALRNCLLPNIEMEDEIGNIATQLHTIYKTSYGQ